MMPRTNHFLVSLLREIGDPIEAENLIDFEERYADPSRFHPSHNIHSVADQQDDTAAPTESPYPGAEMPGGAGGMPPGGGGDMMGAGGPPPTDDELTDMNTVPGQSGQPGMPGQEDQQMQPGMQESALNERMWGGAPPRAFAAPQMMGGFPGGGFPGGMRMPPFPGGGFPGGMRMPPGMPPQFQQFQSGYGRPGALPPVGANVPHNPVMQQPAPPQAREPIPYLPSYGDNLKPVQPAAGMDAGSNQPTGGGPRPFTSGVIDTSTKTTPHTTPGVPPVDTTKPMYPRAGGGLSFFSNVPVTNDWKQSTGAQEHPEPGAEQRWGQYYTTSPHASIPSEIIDQPHPTGFGRFVSRVLGGRQPSEDVISGIANPPPPQQQQQQNNSKEPIMRYGHLGLTEDNDDLFDRFLNEMLRFDEAPYNPDRSANDLNRQTLAMMGQGLQYFSPDAYTRGGGGGSAGTATSASARTAAPRAAASRAAARPAGRGGYVGGLPNVSSYGDDLNKTSTALNAPGTPAMKPAAVGAAQQAGGFPMRATPGTGGDEAFSRERMAGASAAAPAVGPRTRQGQPAQSIGSQLSAAAGALGNAASTVGSYLNPGHMFPGTQTARTGGFPMRPQPGAGGDEAFSRERMSAPPAAPARGPTMVAGGALGGHSTPPTPVPVSRTPGNLVAGGALGGGSAPAAAASAPAASAPAAPAPAAPKPGGLVAGGALSPGKMASNESAWKMTWKDFVVLSENEKKFR